MKFVAIHFRIAIAMAMMTVLAPRLLAGPDPATAQQVQQLAAKCYNRSHLIDTTAVRRLAALGEPAQPALFALFKGAIAPDQNRIGNIMVDEWRKQSISIPESNRKAATEILPAVVDRLIGSNITIDKWPYFILDQLRDVPEMREQSDRMLVGWQEPPRKWALEWYKAYDPSGAKLLATMEPILNSRSTGCRFAAQILAGLGRPAMGPLIKAALSDDVIIARSALDGLTQMLEQHPELSIPTEMVDELAKLLRDKRVRPGDLEAVARVLLKAGTDGRRAVIAAALDRDATKAVSVQQVLLRACPAARSILWQIPRDAARSGAAESVLLLMLDHPDDASETLLDNLNSPDPVLRRVSACAISSTPAMRELGPATQQMIRDAAGGVTRPAIAAPGPWMMPAASSAVTATASAAPVMSSIGPTLNTAAWGVFGLLVSSVLGLLIVAVASRPRIAMARG